MNRIKIFTLALMIIFCGVLSCNKIDKPFASRTKAKKKYRKCVTFSDLRNYKVGTKYVKLKD